MKTSFTRIIPTAILLVIGTVLRTAAQTPPAIDDAVAPPAVSQAGPKIQFAKIEHDFGKVDSGTSVKFDFVFTNSGNATLEVTDVRPSCGCTTTGSWTKSVAPGQSGTIPIQFSSDTFSGPIHKTVTVTSNAPGQSQTILNLKGTVFKAINVNPPAAYFTPHD